MSKSTPYDFGLLGDSTFPTSAPTGMLAGFNPNYNNLMPGGGFSSGFSSPVDISMIPESDRAFYLLASNMQRASSPEARMKALKAELPILEEFYSRQADKAQKLGKESVLFSAAVNSVANLPKIIAQGVGQVRDARLAGQQALLNEAQRRYNVGGFSMPYNTYRV